MAQFRHANIVQLLGVVSVGKPVLVVLEYMEYGSLKGYLEKNDVDEATRLLFAGDCADGLNHVHSKGFVHRDIAARNILVSSERRCKVADFGLARDTDESDYYRSRSGQMPVRWSAPEALEERKVCSCLRLSVSVCMCVCVCVCLCLCLRPCVCVCVCSCAVVCACFCASVRNCLYVIVCTRCSRVLVACAVYARVRRVVIWRSLQRDLDARRDALQGLGQPEGLCLTARRGACTPTPIPRCWCSLPSHSLWHLTFVTGVGDDL